MSRISKTGVITASVISSVGLLLAPATTLALGARATTASTSAFCTNLPTKASDITAKLNDLTGKVTQAWSQQDQKLTADEAKVDQTVTADRARADAERAADFAKLEAKATTDSEKQAVTTYEATVKDAVSTRRAAYDAARQTFRDGVKSAITARQSTITGQMSTFQSSASSALATAEASCASNATNGATIRQTLVASLKSARQTFESQRQADATVGNQVSQLAATRNTAFQTADQTFKNSMTTARTALKQAFGNKSSTV